MRAKSAKDKILIVDDNPEGIWPLIDYLENEFQVICSTSGEECLNIAFSENRPDLILLDIIMPGMDGYDVCSKLKANDSTREIPIIFLTGKTDEHEEAKGLDMGAQDYITKPFSMPVVRSRIKSVLNLKKEMERRLMLKKQLDQLNRQLEYQVQQKKEELKEVRETLKAYEAKYSYLFKKKLVKNETQRILLVDDNPENIHILVENLETQYEVICANNGEKALDIASSDNRPDLILLDIMMPGMDGYEVCSRLKADADTWDIPVIFVTALGQEADETKGLELGAVDFITKPFSIPIVEARVKATLRLKREMDKRVVLTRELEDLNENLEKRVKAKTEELEEAHTELKVSEKKYRTLFEAAGDAIFIVKMEEDGPRFVDFNTRVLEIFKCTREEMMNKTPVDISPLKQSDGRLSSESAFELASAAMEGKPQFFEWINIRKDGTLFPVEVSLRHVDLGKERYIQAIVRDITNRRKIEESLVNAKEEIEAWNRELEKRVKEQTEELVKSQAQLIQSEKLSAMGHMAGGLAHELNSPLAGLLPMIEKYRDMAEKDSEAYMEQSLMLKACKHMGRIVKDFGIFSRESKDEFCELDLNEIIEDTLSFSAVKLRNMGIKIIKEYGDNLQKVQGEKTEIQQVVLNIITNACDAMPNGGRFTIKTGTVEDKNDLTMEFIDNGIGIEKEKLEKIFDPFFTTKGPGKGTGLGLSVSYGIIKKHGGEISVESTPEKGSKFTVLLPAINLK